MKPSILALAFLTGLIAGSPLRAELPAEQKKVLDQFRGKWRIEGTVHKSAAAPEERKLTDTDTAEWTLGGSYLESRGEDSDKHTSLNLFTCDDQQHCYRHWSFGSEGHANETTGQWDAATKTLTWKGSLPGGFILTTTYHFLSADAGGDRGAAGEDQRADPRAAAAGGALASPPATSRARSAI